MPPTSRMYQRLSSTLPCEVVDLILDELDRPALAAAARANSVFHTAALRFLYRTLDELPTARTLACLRTLAHAHAPCAHVRTLTIDWTLARPLAALPILLAAVLRRLPALTALTLELAPRDNAARPGLAWVLAAAPQTLTALTTSLRCDAALARVLEQQPALRELCLRGHTARDNDDGDGGAGGGAGGDAAVDGGPFRLSPGALPCLRAFRAVHAGPRLFRAIVCARPVEAVSLSLFAEDGWATLDALVASARPLRRLTVMSLDTRDAVLLLKAVAQRMPHLEALHVVVLMARFTESSLRDASPVFKRFHALRYLTFMAGGLSVLPEDEEDIAQRWHAACPTLHTIILPRGKVWFERQGKWTYMK